MASARAPRFTTLTVLAVLAGCGADSVEQAASSRPRYALTNVASASGLAFTPTSGGDPSRQLLEVKGGGLALIDFDHDDDLDVFVPNGATLEAPERGPGARLFENLGGLRFRDSTERAGIDLARWSFGCAVGDVDGDGFDDLFVACFGPNVLLSGGPDGRFRETSAESGLEGDAWSTAAALGDLDGDGDLDLYVVNYVGFDPEAPPAPMVFRGVRVFGGPLGLEGQADRVWENVGGGRFHDATSAWGFDQVPASYGLGAVILDLDGDARPEILVGNDSQANFLFSRDADGRFSDRGLASGLALDEHGWGQATMGIAIGDVNEDGLPDVFTSNFMSDHDTLHVNLGNLLFEDRSRRGGIALETHPYLGWACAFVDLDNEGSEELVVFHGHVYPDEITVPAGWRTRQEPQLFERRDGRFERVPPEQGPGWLAAAHRDRGAAFGDLDQDGDVDIVVNELNGPLRLLRNDAARGSWLSVRLNDERADSANRRGLGARIAVQAGSRRQYRWVVSGTSYQSASDYDAHFGLGVSAQPVTVEVTWPDGHVMLLEDVSTDQRLVVRRR